MNRDVKARGVNYLIPAQDDARYIHIDTAKYTFTFTFTFSCAFIFTFPFPSVSYLVCNIRRFRSGRTHSRTTENKICAIA